MFHRSKRSQADRINWMNFLSAEARGGTNLIATATVVLGHFYCFDRFQGVGDDGFEFNAEADAGDYGGKLISGLPPWLFRFSRSAAVSGEGREAWRTEERLTRCVDSDFASEPTIDISSSYTQLFIFFSYQQKYYLSY